MTCKLAGKGVEAKSGKDRVGVGVGVLVGILVGVAVSVIVEVGISVFVEDTVTVGSTTCPAPHALMVRTTTKNKQ